MTLQGQPINQVSGCVYLHVVVIDNLPCSSYMDRSKRTFIKQHNSLYQKFGYVDTIVLLYLFRMNAMPFYSTTTWLLKLHKKDLNNISVVYHKAIERIWGRNFYDINHECLEYACLPNFKHFLARNFFCFALRLFTSKCSCFMIHKHYFKYNSVLRNNLERFLSIK